MRKHTPAPWEWTDKYKTGEGMDTWSLVSDDGYGILSCDGIANSPQGINNEANARLIASAPELLEALNKIDRLPVGGIASDSELLRTAIKIARKAIAKLEVTQ